MSWGWGQGAAQLPIRDPPGGLGYSPELPFQGQKPLPPTQNLWALFLLDGQELSVYLTKFKTSNA